MHESVRLFNVNQHSLWTTFVNNKVFRNSMGFPVLEIIECFKSMTLDIRCIFFGDTEFGEICKVSKIIKPNYDGVSLNDFYNFVHILLCGSILSVIKETLIALRIDIQ